ncbi:Protein GVQW1 [Plecturocebus cupreus]
MAFKCVSTHRCNTDCGTLEKNRKWALTGSLTVTQTRVQCQDLSSLQPPLPRFKQSTRLSLPKQSLALLLRLECTGITSTHCHVFLPGSKMGFRHVGQAGLKLLTSGDLTALASQSAGIIGVPVDNRGFALMQAGDSFTGKGIRSPKPTFRLSIRRQIPLTVSEHISQLDQRTQTRLQYMVSVTKARVVSYIPWLFSLVLSRGLSAISGKATRPAWLSYEKNPNLNLTPKALYEVLNAIGERSEIRTRAKLQKCQLLVSSLKLLVPSLQQQIKQEHLHSQGREKRNGTEKGKRGCPQLYLSLADQVEECPLHSENFSALSIVSVSSHKE